MSNSCKQCGAMLAERDAFCTKCGARRESSAESAAAQRFCTKCGAPLGETQFCTKCGAVAALPTGAAVQARTSGGATSPPGTSSGTTGEFAPQSAAAGSASAPSIRGIPKAALVAVGVVVLVLVLVVVAGVISAKHRAREKAQETEAAQNFAKSLANFASSSKPAAKGGNSPSAADTNNGTNDLANAANALAQKTNGATPADLQRGLNQIDSEANQQTQGGSAVLTAENRNSQGAIDDLKKKLSDLLRDAPDEKSWGTVNLLEGELTDAEQNQQYESSNNLNYVLRNGADAVARLTPAFTAATDAALTPPPIPGADVPIVPVAATGNQAHDWALEYERTVGGPGADLVVRTGDINNLRFGWPPGFDPFSGQSTPVHPGPDIDHIPPNAPPGTDRIMLGTGLTAVHMWVRHVPGELDRVALDSATQTKGGDGYSWAMSQCYAIASRLLTQTSSRIQEPPNYYNDSLWVPTKLAADCTRERQLTMPSPIVLPVGALPSKIKAVVFQIFADDFQSPVYGSHFQVSLNGTRIPTFEYAINSLDQSGPIGKLVTLRLLPEYWPLLKSGEVKLFIDDPTTHVQDGYAVDFVRILVNPHKFKYQVSLAATVTDADTHKPIAGATVNAGLSATATDRQGKCELKGIPAGLVVAAADAPGYDENSVPVDLPVGQSGNADIQLHRHRESTAALEQSIAQTGTATIYGIHFDTGSPKFRADSLPALEAVLGLIHGRPGSNWIIEGHTDNQGSDKINIPLSKARAASVIRWLTAHGIAANRLAPQGFGSTHPVADNATATGRFLNRRVEVSLAK